VSRAVTRAVAAAGLAVVLVGAPATALVAAHDEHGAVAVELAAAAGLRRVPAGFVGLSVEAPSLPAYAGDPGHVDRPLVALLDALGRAQGAPPPLRIGGNSADVSWWDPGRAPAPPSVTTLLGRRWLASLAALEARTHAPLTLTVNLAAERPAGAVAFARAVQGALPGGGVQALELGNEADLFGRPQPTTRGALAPTPFPQLRGYTPARYRADVLAYAAALAHGLPQVPRLEAGAFAGLAWNAALPRLRREARGRLGGVTVHAYPLHGCHEGIRRRDTVAGLLAPSASAGLARRVVAAARLAGVAAGAVRVDELNSVTCGGLAGVSDTFAAALWSLTTLHALLNAGVAGVNLHTFAGAPYAPFTVRRRGPAWAVRARPLYAGMLLFAMGAPAGSRLVGATAGGAAGVQAWATRDGGGTLRVTLVNPTAAPRTVTVGPGATRPASVLFLRAPGAASRGGVTLGGQGIGADGRLHGPRRRRTVVPADGRWTLRLPGMSAALVVVRAPAPTAATGRTSPRATWAPT